MMTAFEAVPQLERTGIEEAVGRAARALCREQKPDGHFVFELEADVSITAEYILLQHYFGIPIPSDLEAKFALYFQRRQKADGGWPLLTSGKFNLSSSVKAYFALKALGDAPDAPHMKRASTAILAHGGAANSNVFTRSLLALFGEVPWRAIPVMPVEIMHLPRWFPIHLTKISYWGRTVLVPLLVVNALKPRARNPKGVKISELFPIPPEDIKHWPASPIRSFPFTEVFAGLDKILRWTEPHFPKSSRKTAIAKAADYVTERLNGENGLGAIYPAMAHSAIMFNALGVPMSDPKIKSSLKAVERLLVIRNDEAYCQPCVSPVWDTALTCHALMEADARQHSSQVEAALEWLRLLQVTGVKGDWAEQRPNVRPGGWAFQYANPHFPDLDDTAVVVMAMDRAANEIAYPQLRPFQEPISRAKEWILGLQSKNGGFGAFDSDNNHEYLNYIPFADHGALLDPPTADVTARCLSMLAQLGGTPDRNPEIRRGLDYLLNEQTSEGSWYGRWGMNYIYGTWSVLCALNAIKLDASAPQIRKAVAWFKNIQNEDGGWGEDDRSYAFGYQGYQRAPSTASQTSWALLGLMAAGEVRDESVAKGIEYLKNKQSEDGLWQEEKFTGTGFPRVFYLRYHGYAKFFPLWALARFNNLQTSNCSAPVMGM